MDVAAFVADAGNLEFEEELARNPYALRCWLRYLSHSIAAPPRHRFALYERALKLLPGSYKLWKMYLAERSERARERSVKSAANRVLVNTYERALVHLHRMPRVWTDYAALLMRLKKVTATRRALDRALEALPVTQHDRIWEMYVPWARDVGVVETAVRVYRRYLLLHPQEREAFVDYLAGAGQWAEAARQLALCVQDEGFVSAKGSSKHAMWLRLCDLCAMHPEETSGSIPVAPMIRAGIRRFSDEVGRLWCKLADYHVRLGEFEAARDVFEEAIVDVCTVRDFSVIFDAYVAFEERLLTAKMAMLEGEGDSEGEGSDGDGEDDDLDVDGDDIDLRLARLEDLMDRRPLLLSSVVLRQNPQDVKEWLHRCRVYEERSLDKEAAACYAEALKTVDAAAATGDMSDLFVGFSRFYESKGDLDSAREVLKRACEVPFRADREASAVRCAAAELELRAGEPQRALAAVSAAVAESSAPAASSLARVRRSAALWGLYADLEESFGSVDTAVAAYRRAMALKCATPQMVLNLARLLQQNARFEEAFRSYEAGLALFAYPPALHIWRAYVRDFLRRYAARKAERCRDLLEQACHAAPPRHKAEFFVAYARFEEESGSERLALDALDRCCAAVPAGQKLAAFQLLAAKALRHFGPSRARRAYEAGIEAVGDAAALELCLGLAALEAELGEAERARAVFLHATQFADPRRGATRRLWAQWHAFEVENGDEDSFRDMLREKRRAKMRFDGAGRAAVVEDSGVAVGVAEEGTISGFVAASDAEGGARKRKADEGGAAETELEALERNRSRSRVADDAPAGEDEDEDEDELDIDLEEKSVPAAVFGGAAEGK